MTTERHPGNPGEMGLIGRLKIQFPGRLLRKSSLMLSHGYR
jgi:hypothetical protein